MVYLNKNIFKNILSYCDDRIEVKQRKLNSKLISDLSLLQEDLLSCVYNFIIETSSNINNFDDYMNNDEIRNNLYDLIDFASYEDELSCEFDNELIEDFLDVLIVKSNY
jgi:hypothetical protein